MDLVEQKRRAENLGEAQKAQIEEEVRRLAADNGGIAIFTQRDCEMRLRLNFKDLEAYCRSQKDRWKTELEGGYRPSMRRITPTRMVVTVK